MSIKPNIRKFLKIRENHYSTIERDGFEALVGRFNIDKNFFVKVKILGKDRFFGYYEDIITAKKYMNFLMELFCKVNRKNFKEHEDKIECMFESKTIKTNIYNAIVEIIENEFLQYEERDSDSE